WVMIASGNTLSIPLRDEPDLADVGDRPSRKTNQVWTLSDRLNAMALFALTPFDLTPFDRI
ncbi:MAG: hypothetical protein ACRESX_05680, partial [Gammaproteobacteria bacterium]